MLSNKINITVKFNEVDPLGIVWHGHYIRFFEDGREAFGKAHGLTYMQIYERGFVAPVVKINCDYKKSLEYGDEAIIETIYIPSPAAKIIFNYRIYLANNNELIAEGNSVQVFLDAKSRMLQLIAPEFYNKWMRDNKLGPS